MIIYCLYLLERDHNERQLLGNQILDMFLEYLSLTDPNIASPTWVQLTDIALIRDICKQCN